MKKVIIAILSVLMIFGLVACGGETEKKTFIVSFVQNGCENVIRTVKEGEDVMNIPTPKDKVGYTVEWEGKDLTNVKSDMTVNAVETPNTYTITYDANGGTVSAQTQNVAYGTDYTLLTPEKDGYDFVCWVRGESNILINGKWEIAENVTLKAKWQETVNKQYVITFFFLNNGYVTRTVKEGESLTIIPENTQIEGYDTFWDKTTFENVRENQTVTEQKVGKTYVVTYDANGGTVSAQTQNLTYGSDYTLLTPEKDGYDFVCWTSGESDILINGKWGIAKNLTLTAKWQEVAIEQCAITFIYLDNTSVTKTVQKGETLTDIPQNSVEEGYDTFWDRTTFENVTKNLTVTEQKVGKTYVVTYDANGGTVSVQTQNVAYGTDYTLLTPEKDGYDFVCWTSGESDILINGKWGIAENVTLTAKWQKVAIEQCAITFIYLDNTSVTKTVNKGDTLTDIPQNSVKEGYDTFWDRTNFENITKNLTVTEQKVGKTYTITFNANGGAVIPLSKTVKYGDAYALPTPTFSNHTFAGWKYNSNTITSGNSWSIANDVELVATWTNVTYTITLDYGRSASWVSGKGLPTSITVEFGESLSGKIPTIAVNKDDEYMFKGWKIKGASEKFTDATFNFTENIELVAIWSRQWTDNY